MTSPPTTECPVPDMTTGEIFRYLDDGYPSGVQSALASHVETCETCSDAVDRARQMRQSGHATLLAALDSGASPANLSSRPKDPAQSESDSHVGAMALARFVDGTAPDSERVAITEHLVDCPKCYRQFADMSEELSAPPTGFTAPREARERVRATVEEAPTVSAPSVSPQKKPAPGLVERITTALDELLAPRWVVGLGGAVAGLLLALLIFGTPPDRVVVPLASGSDGSAEGSGRVMSGMNPAPPSPAVTLPTTEPTFTWASLPNATRYTVSVTGAGGNTLLKTSTEDAEWSSPADLLAPGETYVFVVTADLESGAVVPLNRLRFQVSDGGTGF